MKPHRSTPGLPARSAGARRLRGVLLDITPLRLDRDYRWWWVGQTVSATGNQITRAALRYQVYVLTGSILTVGVLTFVQFIGVLVFALWAGSLADAFDRRRLLLVAQAGMAVSTIALIALALVPSPPIEAIYGIAFVGAGLTAADHSLRLSAIPRLVPRGRLPAAIALNQVNQKAAAIVGPALAGILIASFGVAGAYTADAATFVASLAALLVISPIPPLPDAPRPGLSAIREGLRFVVRQRVVLGAVVSNVSATIFAVPTALYPALALDVFKVGPVGFGLLGSAPAVGALSGALMSGWISSVRRTGRATVVALAAWGLAITTFGLLTFSFPLALLVLAIAGGTDVVASVLRLTIVQLETPDEVRGRVTSVYSMSALGATRLGDIEATLVGALVGAQWSVVSGGILCLASVLAVVRLFPELPDHIAGHRERAPAHAAVVVGDDVDDAAIHRDPVAPG